MSGHEWAVPGALALGAWHGINPAMGWLFAVALGMQERRLASVWRALGPLAAGHALAVAAVVFAAVAAGFLVPVRTVQWTVAAVLVGMGVYRLIRSRHPRYGGMRVGAAELAIWSLLMATAHGAGLMLAPLVLRDGAATAAAVSTAAGLTVLHTAAYLLVTALIASVVFRWLGLRQLRRLWLNLDLAWGVALVATGVATPIL